MEARLVSWCNPSGGWQLPAVFRPDAPEHGEGTDNEADQGEEHQADADGRFLHHVGHVRPFHTITSSTGLRGDGEKSPPVV